MKRVVGIIMALGCAAMLCACSAGVFENETQSGAAIDPLASSVSEAQVTLVFSFGERTGTYTGETAGGLPHGQGTFESSNLEGVSWVYEGGWKQGHMCGEGATTFETGYAETGWYDNDYLSGQGTARQDGRILYEGAFTDSIPDGEGTLYSYSGEAIYSGSFDYGYIDETKEARDIRVERIKQQCAAAQYDELYESAQNEDGAYVRVTGEVACVTDTEAEYESGFVVTCQGGVNSGYVNQVYVSYHLSVGEKPVLEGQTVTVWAQAACLDTADEKDGPMSSLPLIEAWDVKDTGGVAL